MCTTLCSEDTLFTKFKTVSTVGITCSNKRWVDWCGRSKNHHPSPPLLNLNQNCFCGLKVFTWQFLFGQSGLKCNTKKIVSSVFSANTDITGLKKFHGWLSRLMYSYYFTFNMYYALIVTCLVAQMIKHLPTVQETRVQSLGQEDLLEKGMITLDFSTLAWKIPWTEEPGRLQSMGSQRVRHDWATSLSLYTYCVHRARLCSERNEKEARWNYSLDAHTMSCGKAIQINLHTK